MISRQIKQTRPFSAKISARLKRDLKLVEEEKWAR